MENVTRSIELHDFHLASRKAKELLQSFNSCSKTLEFFIALRRYQAVQWLECLVGPLGISDQPLEREFNYYLRNGLILCSPINKIQPGSVPKETFEAGSVARIVDCILALKSYHELKLPNALSTEPCRCLGMLTGFSKESPEEYTMKPLTNIMVDIEENIGNNFLASLHARNLDPVKALGKILGSCLEEQLQHQSPECGPSSGLAKDMGIHCFAPNDLFQLSNQRKDIISYEIRSHHTNDGLSLLDYALHFVKSTVDVLNLMKHGDENHAVNFTALNNQCSRSHSLISEKLLHPLQKQLTYTALARCFSMTDLIQLDCSHMPYSLTIGGHAKTLMFAHVSLEGDDFGETLGTLKFARRVSGIELGAACLNKQSSEVGELKQ
ncbi:hypothetical protein Ancab_031025 [Ancistrocladus abbreviatus]